MWLNQDSLPQSCPEAHPLDDYRSYQFNNFNWLPHYNTVYIRIYLEMKTIWDICEKEENEWVTYLTKIIQKWCYLRRKIMKVERNLETLAKKKKVHGEAKNKQWNFLLLWVLFIICAGRNHIKYSSIWFWK